MAILISKTLFKSETVSDVTSAALSALPSTVLLDPGELLVVSVEDVHHQPFLLVSFRGEDTGRSATAVLDAVHALLATMPTHRLVIGLDADTRAITSRYLRPQQ